MERKEQIKANFGLHLRKLLKERDVSLRSLATQSGLEYTQVQRIAAGKVNASLTTIVFMAEGLNIPPAELMIGLT